MAATGRSAVEVRSIDYVPASERHGEVWRQGPFWFLGNFQPFTLALGLIGPSLGLSLAWTVLASVLGILFGTLFMAFHASQGPVLGLPQMIQSRAQFGYRGVVVPLVATLFTFVAFNVVDVVIIKAGLNGIFGWDTTLVAVVVTVVATVLAIYGHDWLHTAFATLFVISVPLFVILTVGIAFGAAGGATPEPGTYGFGWAAFLAQFTVVAAYNVTYSPYVSDYSRYLPQNTPTRSIVGAVFWGASGSPIWLIPIGAWLATRLGAVDALVGLKDAGDGVFTGLGSALAVISVLALVATMGLNAYSAMLTVITGVDSLRPVRPTAGWRIAVIVALAGLWLLLGLLLADAVGALFTSLTLMLYLLTPWTAVNLVDYFYVRRGHYAITDLFTSRGIYGAWGTNGLIAYGAGLLAEVPFMVLKFSEDVRYVGPAAGRLEEVDIAFILGLIVASAVYLLLMRRVDLAAEQPAIAESERVLAELDGQAGVDTVTAVRA
jgi:NCS1 family nucleobase:cation symporter-1